MVLSRSLIMPRLSRPQAVAAQSSFEAPPFVEQLQPGDPPVVKPKPKPVEARRVVPDVQLWKPAVVKPPFASTGPEHPLNCHNETSPTGRVRVICD